jgi:hypothetical protein
MKKFVLKLLKIIAISIPALILLMFLIPMIFPGPVVKKVKAWANQSLDGEVNFSKVRLTFFDHFPSLTTTLHDVTLKGSAPFKKDTLVAANEISLGINLASLLFKGRINIDKIFVSKGFINVQVNKKGEANYNVYVSEKKNTKSADTASAALKLEKIQIQDIRLVYNDRSVDMLLDAKGFDYTGNGDLSKDIFDLSSHAKIDSLNFILGSEPYLINKKVDAELITKVNTNSLAFFFEKNNLKINKLPVQFSGKLDFLQNGYDMDFTVSSSNSKLEHLITALPPQYLKWLEKTKVDGFTDILLKLNGKYIASQNIAPELIFDMNIRNGFINYNKAPLPASDIFLVLHSRLPSLNPDHLELKVDSIHLKAGRNYLKGNLSMLGTAVSAADIHTDMDLEQVDRALGIEAIDLKGKCVADIVVRQLNYDIEAKGKVDFASASRDSLSFNGSVDADLKLKGNQDDAINGRYDKLDNSGTLKLRNIKIISHYLPSSLLIKNGSFVFDKEKMLFQNFIAGYDKSEFVMNGFLQNVVSYYLSDKEILKGDFNLKSDRVNVNDLVLERINADVSTDTGAYFLNNLVFSTIGCDMQMQAKYKPLRSKRALFDYTVKANDFDIKRAYDSVKLFRDLATAAAYTQGIVSLDYTIKGVLDENMHPIYPSLEGGGTVYLKDVKVKGYKLFNVISKKTGKDSVDNPNMKKVAIKSTIKNNIINIERFKFKVFGFRPRIEGQTSFDGALNLKMRLGLPPLGIIGIPIKVVGTQDEPIIKLGRKTKNLEETEFIEEN